MALQSSATWQERKVDQKLEEFVAHINKCLSVTKTLASGVQQRTQSWKQGDRSKECFFKVSAILETASMYCISFTEDLQDWMNQNEMGQGQNASPISASNNNNNFTFNSLIKSVSSTSSMSVSVSQGDTPSSTVARTIGYGVPSSQPSCCSVATNLSSSPPLSNFMDLTGDSDERLRNGNDQVKKENVPSVHEEGDINPPISPILLSSPPMSNNVDLTEYSDEGIRNGNDQVKKEDVPSVHEEGDITPPEHSSTLAPSAHLLAHAPGHHNVKAASVRNDKHHRLSPMKKINLDLLEEKQKRLSDDEMNDDVTVSNFCDILQETRSEPEVYIDRDCSLSQDSTIEEEITDVTFSLFHDIPLETKSEPEVYIDTDCCLSEQAAFQETIINIPRLLRGCSVVLTDIEPQVNQKDAHVALKDSGVYSCADCCMTFSCPLYLQRHRLGIHDDNSTCVSQPSQMKSMQGKCQIHDSNTKYDNDQVHDRNRNGCTNDQVKIVDCQLSNVSSHGGVRKNCLPQTHNTGKGSNNFGCEVCGKKFISNSKLQTHMRSHTGEKPFKCHVCGKKFSVNCNLQTHKMIHTGEKPFTCLKCGAAFTQNAGLQKHHKRIHTCPRSNVSSHGEVRKNCLPQTHNTGKGNNNFGCEVCGKKFTYNYKLQIHMRSHTREKPFQCHVCGKKFTVNGGLQRHKMIHTGEKPFTCLDCGAAFNLNENLQRHKIIHTGEKPFTCLECGAAFNRNSSLQKHHERIHTG